MRVTIETTNTQELELLIGFLQKLNPENVKIVESTEREEVKELKSSIVKGDKSIDTNGLFGMWAKNPRTIEEIRSKSWNRNWNNNLMTKKYENWN